MSSNSDSAQMIALPQGGGALDGIGEKFSPDLHSGTGNFTVPIAVPPGRNGFQPKLTLQYSTGNGNDIFGFGWSLSVPGVIRKTSDGVPRYQDVDDVFVLSGAEDLVPINGSFPGVVRYRPRTEGLFARIDYHRDADNSFWIVHGKDGLISTYGTPASLANDPAAIADPDEPAHVFAWKLTETRDPFGNRIRYEYERDPNANGEWAQVYLRRIQYIDVDAPAPESFLASVEFVYEDRPDSFSHHRSGFQIRTTRRCNRIEVRTHAVLTRRVRTYQFVYIDQRVVSQGNPTGSAIIIGDVAVEPLEADALPINGASLLSQIHAIGRDDASPRLEDRIQRLPPLEFNYSRFSSQRRDLVPLLGRDLPDQALSDPELELVDLFGNGLPDFIEMNGAVRYWRNLGGGRFDLPRAMDEAPSGLSFADPGVQMIDANGDGRPDLLVSKPGLSGYYPLSFGGHWDRRSFQRYRFAPGFDLESADVKLVDLNGDGVTDAIRSANRLECYFNDPIEGWGETRRVERQAVAEFPDVNFADSRVRWADMSGDGLQDIVLVYDGNIEYWPSLGYGNWGRRVHMRNSPRFPLNYDPRQILIGDVDGDGAADLVFVDHGKIVLWINQSGNGWSDPIEIDGTPGFTNQDEVRLVDLLGTGVAGLLWSQRVLGNRRERGFFLDFTGGTKPHLLNEMNNHRGAITQVTYRSSTEEYRRDQARRETRWKTTLPFPVQVVSRVVAIDQFSRGRLTTEYRYHHGYWDGGEREYRGFGFVEALSTETFEDYNAVVDDHDSFDRVEALHYSPPTVTRTWFHVGPVGDLFGEWEAVDHRDEYWPGDASFFDEERNQLEDFIAQVNRRRDRRDALRALRGSVIRTELYALDGSPREGRPYTVTESVYGLREVDQPPNESSNRRRIFFPHPRAQRSTQWERSDDPLTEISYTDDYDEYGQPRRQLRIACPRGWRDFENDSRAGTDYLATYSETRFAQRDDDFYLVDRVAATSSFQIYPPQDQSAPAVTVTQLQQQAFNGSAPRELIGQAFNHYDGDAFAGLPLGEPGEFGALVRTETLVTTEAILAEAYQGDDAGAQSAIPPYLDPSGAVLWPDEYPEVFRQGMPPLAGYRFNPGDADHARGYFVDSIRNRHDFQTPGAAAHRGMLLATLDALERETTIAHDEFNLLPERVTNPAGLATTARNDYRVLQPDLITDPNGNRTAVTFIPLGLPGSIAVMGKEDEPPVGDTLATPGVRFEYDFLAYDNSTPNNRQPVSVRTIKRVHHVNDTDISISNRDDTIDSVEYSDGFGRLLQTRAQAEDVLFGNDVFGNNTLPSDQGEAAGTRLPVIGRTRNPDDSPNVVVSGWQIYDNKGKVVEKYEPFFDTGWEYLSLEEAQRQREEGIRNLFGRSIVQFYDPRGHVIRTVNPDGSEQRVIHGVPLDSGNPDTFNPTPWEAYTYDANDLAPLSEGLDANDNPAPLASRAPVSHHFTPSSIEIDALGRTIRSIQRNGAGQQDVIETTSTYDVRGNLLTVTDALGRNAFRYTCDLANQTVRVQSIDAGVKRTVLDAYGNGIEQRDSKGAMVLSAHDALNRIVELWARDDPGQRVTLRQHLVYGDHASEIGIEPAEARGRNALAQMAARYDEAGLVLAGDYDFKGNLLEKTRQVINDQELLSVFQGAADNNWQVSAYQVDWQPPATSIEARAAAVLDPTDYTTSTRYDALNRVIEVIYPRDADNERKVLRAGYNRAGALESITLDGDLYVEHIAYNARGQRTLIAYGNGVMTRYAYDPHTFRLSRLRSERYSRPDESSYQPEGAPLQDFGYEYDLAGNIVAIRDRTPESGIPNTLMGTDALDRRFTYDPIYRLLSATGRECDVRPPIPPWFDEPRCTDRTRARAYTERYQYDPLGNMLSLQHQNTTGGFTREFAMAAGSNRLETLTIGQAGFAYAYDANGNMTRETTSRHFEWDYADRMKVFRTQTDGAEPSIHAHYLYDADGRRVQKLVRRQGGSFETTVYIAQLFEHHRTEALHNNTLHVMDDQERVARLRVGEAFAGDSTPSVAFSLGDHLGSANVLVGRAGNAIHREEYGPYGETTFGSFARKRYRYTGKERDEESGFNYHHDRYYGPWLARWTAPDACAAVYPQWSSYVYSLDRPIVLRDPSGLAAEEPSNLTPEAINERLKAANKSIEGAAQRADQISREATKIVKSKSTLWEKLTGSASKRLDKLWRELFSSEFSLGKELKRLDEMAEQIRQEGTKSYRTNALQELERIKARGEEVRDLVRRTRFDSKLFGPWGGKGGSPGPKGGGGGGGGGVPPAPRTPPGGSSLAGKLLKSIKVELSRVSISNRAAGLIGLAIAGASVALEVHAAPEGEGTRAGFGAVGEEVGKTGGAALEGGILTLPVVGTPLFAVARYFDMAGRVGNVGRGIFESIYDLVAE